MLPGEAFRGENITDENCTCYAGGWKQPRFGSNKLLYEIDGKPMYLLTLEKLKKASEKIPESEIIVVTQYEEIVKKAGEMKIPVFINPRPKMEFHFPCRLD